MELKLWIKVSLKMGTGKQCNEENIYCNPIRIFPSIENCPL